MISFWVDIGSMWGRGDVRLCRGVNCGWCLCDIWSRNRIWMHEVTWCLLDRYDVVCNLLWVGLEVVLWVRG
jgi:hypothetical protein